MMKEVKKKNAVKKNEGFQFFRPIMEQPAY